MVEFWFSITVDKCPTCRQIYKINSAQLSASLKVLGINKDEGQCVQKTVAEGRMGLPLGEFIGYSIKDLCKISILSVSWGEKKPLLTKQVI